MWYGVRLLYVRCSTVCIPYVGKYQGLSTEHGMHGYAVLILRPTILYSQYVFVFRYLRPPYDKMRTVRTFLVPTWKCLRASARTWVASWNIVQFDFRGGVNLVSRTFSTKTLRRKLILVQC